MECPRIACLQKGARTVASAVTPRQINSLMLMEAERQTRPPKCTRELSPFLVEQRKKKEGNSDYDRRKTISVKLPVIYTNASPQAGNLNEKHTFNPQTRITATF